MTEEYNHPELDFSEVSPGENWYSDHQELTQHLQTLVKHISRDGLVFSPEAVKVGAEPSEDIDVARLADLPDTSDFSTVGHNHSGESLSPQSVSTGELSGTYPGLVYGLADGEVVAAIDPSTTATPVQDAIDAVAAIGTGLVWLPPAVVQEDTTINMHEGVSIKGLGRGRTNAGGTTSVIEIQTEGVTGIRFGNSAGGGNLELDGFVLRGQGDDAAAADAIKFADSNFSDLVFGTLGISGWYGSAMGSDQNARVYQSNLGDHIYVDNVDAGDSDALFDLHLYGPENEMGLLSVYPTATTSGDNTQILYVTQMSISIRKLNVGGTAGMILETSNHATYLTEIGTVNYEPSSQPGGAPSQLYRCRSIVHVGRTVVNGASGNTETAYVYELYYGNRHCKLGTVHITNGATVSNSIVNIDQEPSEHSFYYGPSSDVTNNAGSSTDLVVCLGDLSTAG